MEVGLFGKLPSHGDFLRRRVVRRVRRCVGRLAARMPSGEPEALGERWLDLYLTSPAWRFVCCGGRRAARRRSSA